jgi:hypothetical protein
MFRFNNNAGQARAYPQGHGCLPERARPSRVRWLRQADGSEPIDRQVQELRLLELDPRRAWVPEQGQQVGRGQ